MQNKHTTYIFVLFIFLLIFNVEGLSQKKITYKVENQPLNLVLNKISSITKVRFAFDDDYLSKINVSFNVNNLSVDEFLKQLCLKFPVNYKLIGQTWVVYKDEKKVVAVRPKPKVAQKVPVKPPPISRKIVYKKARLWDLVGTVIDMKSGNRLKFSQLLIDEFTNPVTNDLGFFSDEIVSTGDVRIKVNQFGFYPLDTTLILFDGKDIVLKLNPIWAVNDSSNNSFSSIFQIELPEGSDFVALNPRSGTYISGIDASDLVNSLKLIPGIDFIEGENAGLSARGTSPSENQILLDGVPVLNYSHLFGQLSVQNSKFIHQTFISRGGFGVEYGGSSSGIVELTGKMGLRKKVVDFSANLLDANLFVGIPITSKISVSGSVRKSIVDYWPNYYYQNLVTAPVSLKAVGTDAPDGKVSDPFSSFYDINMKVAYQPNDRSEVDFIFTNGYDNQKRHFGITSDETYYMDFKSNWRNYGLGVNWKFQSRNSWFNTIVASYNQLNQKNNVQSGSISELVENGEFVHSDQDLNNKSEMFLKWKSEFSRKKFSYQFGAEYNFNHLEYNYNEHSTGIAVMNADTISANNTKHQANLFFQCKYKLYNWIELTAGLRGLFDFSIFNASVQPRAGVDITPNTLWKFYYRFGRYDQSFYQTQRVGANLNTVPVWFLPNDAKRILKSYHNIVGVNYSKKGLFVNIEGYRMNSSGKAAYFANRGSEDISINEPYKIYTGSGIRQGVDATIQFNQNLFNHSIAYSYSDSKEKFNGINNDQYFPSYTHHRHRLQLTETLTYSGWIASARFNYYTGAPYLLQNSTLERFDRSRLSDFSQLDISLVRQFSLKSLKIETGAVLLNVMGAKNEKGIEFFRLGETTSDFILKSTTAGISFTPTFFISLKFD
jgi:hypothetical protein